ncbi:MAG TPA: 6-hydroxymethylpterin diphosphokinase MptE-like protein [Aromatoleum sp.]|uniref:6-hydroxymethylpterin diphosphokinase MptE-like protein n=1 Tax=Aromatoleum sp. TaxID=2307007 RepID=UPI002B45A82C|nr:6-hydroxymethylpterin diphosphokinase MptE-like protein [Aromatoleum sp.]HJV25555.1 6-hydroxymethylpterin diphosphokinase MptE-like protein [Aromatoleum sp.]
MLHNRHAGGRCVIVANGPSLNKMELGFLRSETVIGMNKIYLGFRKFGFYPRYYVAINAKVIEQSLNEIGAMNCVKFIGSQGAMGRISEGPMTYLINTTTPPARFCHDISRGVHEGFTVTHAALQIAYYLGFQEVVLIGLDHRYEFSGKPNEARTLDGPDPNHFSESYFGHGQRWDNPDLAHSEESYALARLEFQRAGRRIIDATLDGACPTFEKADYRELFFR